MNILSEKEAAEKAAIAAKYSEARRALNAAIFAYNDRLFSAWAKVEEALSAVHATEREIEALVESVRTRLGKQFDSLSSKEKDGPKESSLLLAVEEWECFSPPETVIDPPDALLAVSPDDVNDFQNLPEG